jgi:hypothetical protein
MSQKSDRITQKISEDRDAGQSRNIEKSIDCHLKKSSIGRKSHSGMTLFEMNEKGLPWRMIDIEGNDDLPVQVVEVAEVVMRVS